MMRNDKSRRRLLLLSVAGVLCLLGQQADAEVQKFVVEEINPDRSTLDKFDPFGASGGRVNHVAISAQDGTMYAASEWGGLFRSTDKGDTWEHLPGHVPVATWDIAVDPKDARRIYATSFYDGKVASLAGINVSLDGGNSWFHPPSATPPEGICLTAARRDEPSAFGISIDPSNTNRVYIGTNCGLAISDDRGLTWRFVDPTPADGADDVWDVIVHDRGIIDLIGDDGHQRSTDGGGIWTSAGFLPGGLGSIVVSPDEPDVLFATTGTLVWESPDGGNTWTGLTNPNVQGRIPFVKTNQRAGANFDLWFGDVSLNQATCTTPAGGGSAPRCPPNSWVTTGDRSNGAHADMGDVAFDPQAADDACPLLISSDGGVYLNTVTKSPDCHTPSWEQPTRTPHALWLWDLSGTSYPGALNDVVIGRRSNVNMRYEILDDGAAAFAQIHSGGSGWGSGNFTTSVATGDVDRDGLTEYVVGRQSSVNMRYEILDDANAGFAQMRSGGSGWGSGNYTTSVATGDIDGDGLDEIVIGRRSDVNMRYEVLDDAKANFVQLHSGGSGWGSGNYTTSVATGDVDGDGLDEIIIGRRSDVNMRYEILDDAKAGFAQIHSGGSGWGSGNYTTSVATGELDGDEADEIVIGRRSNVNMRYEILDDANASFAQIHSGGSGWGSGNFTRAVAAGDLDNDGIDEVVIGRESSVNMRYEILDDAKASFAQIHSGGSGWGSGNYTTAVAVGPTSGGRLDLYFGNQDTGTFASTNAEDPKPTWLNVDCCDSFEVPSNQTQMLVTVCCFSVGRFNRLVLRQPGMIDGAEINTYPPGNLRGFRPTDDVAMFGPTSAAVITTSGVFITTNINASPIVWTQLGAATTPANARHVTPVGQAPRTIFYVQAPSGDLSSPDTVWRYAGTAPGAAWQQVLPPGGVGNLSMYAVDPQNPQRIIASHLPPGGVPPTMVITVDGGTNWNPLPALDAQMNWGGAFVTRTQRGPSRFTGFNGYPQPTLAAFSPADPNLIIAAGIDSGVFVTTDAGATWDVVSDPFNPTASGTPHIPRPKFAHFDHLADGPDGSKVDIYVGTRGRGVFRIRLAYGPRDKAGGSAGPRPETAGGAGPPDDRTGKQPEPKPERPGKPDPSDDPIGKQVYAPKPERPGKPDPSDDPIGKQVYELKPEYPGKADPSDDPIGRKAYEPKPE